MTAQQAPPVDIGNQLLAEVAALFTTAIVDMPAGQRLALTIRTASTTVTILLPGADAKKWAAQLAAAAGQMSGAGLAVANGHAAILRPQP